MDLVCYLHPGWDPAIRPAPSGREWMDATNHGFAHRCLPLGVANAHGWEILSPCAFTARWNGGPNAEDLRVDLDPAVAEALRPVSLFGHGVLTFHVAGLFRTPPGWNLWVGGSPNRPKEGVYPLTGLVETDWSPYTFTLNWMFTRRNHRVSFAAGEPVGFFFPVPRGVVDRAEPRFVPFDRDPDALAQFAAWGRERGALQARVAADPGLPQGERWQKRYYRGLDMHGRQAVPDHATKSKPRPFRADAAAAPAACPVAARAIPPRAPAGAPGFSAEAFGRALRRASEELAGGGDGDVLRRCLREMGVPEREAAGALRAALGG